MDDERIRVWDADMGEWRDATVEVTAGPRRVTRHIPRVGIPASPTDEAMADDRPVEGTGLPGSDYEWTYTAYAPGTPLADMRAGVEAQLMHPHVNRAQLAPESDSNPSPARVARWVMDARHEKTARKNRKDVR